MNEERKIETEQVDAVESPPRARVTPEFERKRDYLAGFLSGAIEEVPEYAKNGDLQASVTLTTPHCPVAESLPNEVELRVLSVPGIRDAEVKLVWDPPWDPSRMSDEARLELGML